MGLEGDKRLVALVHLRHGVFAGALPGRPHARAARVPADDLRAIDNKRVEAGAGEEMPEDRGHGGLAAGARHSDEAP